MKGTLKDPGTFQGSFSLDSVVEVIIPRHSLKKENRLIGNIVNLEMETELT